MQVGEPVAVLPAAPPAPDTELAAELVSVTFKSGIRVSHEKVTIEGPHWERGQERKIEEVWSRLAALLHLPAEPYSRRAAVYLAKGFGAQHGVEVKVRVTKSKNVSGPARLVGMLCGLTIEGTCPTGTGEHTVSAQIIDPPAEIQAFRGRIAWRLEVEATSIQVSLGSTLVELYFILGQPSVPYRVGGVWVEALRFLCGRVGLVGESNRTAVTAKITAHCHGRHGLRYDTEHGRSKYDVDDEGGVFNLEAYLARKKACCNCYDQAAAVQALAGAVGAQSIWLHLKPFGYINPTNLVGVGLCNNPFFGKDESKRMVAPESDDRSAFGNHAFVVSYGGMILDACAKPHLATETAGEYVSDSIDANPSLYGGGFRPGRPKDIRPKTGVVGVK